MNTYYVATYSCWVLVEADHELVAKAEGYKLLKQRYEDEYRARGKTKKPVVEVRTVRLASVDEIKEWEWHKLMIERESVDVI